MLEYDVNLDIMESSNRLSSSYIAIEFNGGEKKLLNTLESVETSYSKTDYIPVEGRYLTSGELGANESKSYSLKLWMDESVTVGDDAMNKNFISKVVVTAKQSHVVRLVDMVQLGDYISYTPSNTNFVIESSLTGCPGSGNYKCPATNQTINPSELTLWKVISKNEDNTLDIVSVNTSSNVVYFFGETGYKNLVGALNTIAAAYADVNFISRSRHMGYSNQTLNVSSINISSRPWTCSTAVNCNAIESQGGGDLGFENDVNLVKAVFNNSLVANNGQSYWLASRYYQTEMLTSSDPIWRYYIRKIDATGNFGTQYMIAYGGQLYIQGGSSSIRPILTIKSDILYQSGNGTQENPFRISINE